MNLIFSIALRNLVRQKRRNILLGIAIAFGAMILVLANSFSHGISEVIFNKIVVYVAGHVSVNFIENGNIYTSVCRDGKTFLDIVEKNVPELTSSQEAIGIMARAIGNGKSDNVIMVGMDIHARTSKEEEEEAKRNFKMVEGAFENLDSTSRFEHPVLLSVEKAKYLNLKFGDVLRIRFTDLNGQVQAARLTVAGIFNPANMFMSAPIFLDLKDIKKLMNYGPNDIAQLYINVKDPRKNAIAVADRLHGLCKPSRACIAASVKSRKGPVQATILGIKGDTTSMRTMSQTLKLVAGDSTKTFGKEGVIISDSLAQNAGLSVGDSLVFTYKSKYGPDSVHVAYVIDGIFFSMPTLGGPLALIADKRFYKTYYADWPIKDSLLTSVILPADTSALGKTIGNEWLLLDRTKSTSEVKDRYRKLAGYKTKAMLVDISSMYETASDVLKLEAALNIITLAAVMVLFFIILIGVINTLRMTIRERTREIGTIRAIGMQKTDVRNTFIVETLLLAIFAAAAGTVMAFLAMWLMSIITINAGENPLGMLLDNGHLYFAPTAAAVIVFNVLIWILAAATAWFPAKKAAQLSAAEALRHYE